MTDYDGEPSGRDSDRADLVDLRRDLYRYLNVIFASSHWDELGGFVSPVFGRIHADLEITELVEGLFNLALHTGVLLEQHAPRLDLGRRECGTVVVDRDASNARRPLGLLEACSKVIEASHEDHDVHTSRLEHRLRLYGEEQGTQWVAELDIVQFARHVLELTEYLQEEALRRDR